MEADENAEDASWGQEQQDNKKAEQTALIATTEEVKSPTDEPETAAEVAEEIAAEDVEVAELSTVDETDIVARAIQQLVTLPRLNTALWSDDARAPLRRFVEERSEEALCIALVDDQLVATSGPQLPEGASPKNPHMVFFRLTNEPLRKEKLFSQVGYFSVPNHTGEAVLRILESGFTQPFIFNNTTWPLSMKTSLCSLLHQLFGELGRTQYAAKGLTLLYIPTEGFHKEPDAEVADDNSIMLGRLEDAVSRWHEQVSTAVTVEQLGAKLPLVTDLVAFWNTKYDNMRFLEQQLYGESVQQILPLLDAAQSDAARLLRSIISQAAEGKKEAKSNRKVLSALVSPSNEVAACNKLTTELVPKAVTLINTARVVWLHAPHFKSRSRVTQLFSCLSHQIIDVCTRTVNLRAIFRGRPVYGIARVSECITACRDYMRVYEEVADKHRKHTEHDWDIDSQEIFSSVYTFIKRCKDLKEVCEAMMIFGRINEKESVAKPKFVGMNSTHFSEICESIMFDTKKEVELLAERKHEALDVTCNTWQEGMDRFRQQMTKVERRVVALTHGVMEKATTVEEGLQALGSLAHYLQKPSLHNLLEEKSNLVYNLLLTCIDSVSRSVLGGETLGCEDMPPYSGAALVAQLNKNHLKQQLKMLTESKYLAKQCEQREVVTRECKFITEVLDEATQEYYDRWAAAALISDWEARLRRPLLTNSPVVAGAIETTLSREVLEILAEARVWNNLGFKPPGHVRDLCNREGNLNELRKNMVTICKTYNDALATFSDAEKCVFKEYILRIDRNLYPAFTTFSWVSQLPPTFISKSLQYVEEFKLLAGQFHEDCEAILLACRKIANSRLVNIQPECLYQTRQLKNDLRNAIKPQYESMLKLLANIKRGLRTSHSQDIHWVNFVSKISDLAEEAIIIAVRNELQKLLNILMENPDVLVHLRATIKNEEITFEPSIGDVQSIVMHTLDCIKRHSKSVPSIMESIKLQSKKKNNYTSLSAKIFEDSKCQELQCHLNEAMESCAEQLRQYAESWEQLSWVWKIDRDKFEAEYRSKKPVASAVAQDTDRMLSMLEDANISTSCVIMFVHVDATDVQTALESHVEGWRHVLLNLMLFSTQTLTEKFQLDLESDISKLLTEPSTLQEVAEKTIFCQIATVHIPCKENALKLVEEHKEILAHYEIQIPQNLQQLLAGIRDKWNEYLSTVNTAKDSLEISKESFRSSLVDNGNVLTRELTKVCSEVHKSGPFDTAWEETDALQFLETSKKTLTEIQIKKEALGRDFELFGIEPPALPELTDIQTVLDVLSDVWETRATWLLCWNKYKKCQFSNLQTKELQSKVHVISKKLTRLAREPAREWPVLEKTRNEVENLRHALPLVLQLRNPAMRPRHWQSVQTALNRHFDPKSDEFTLKEAMTMGITNFEEEIKAISRDASMEFEIETGLSDITKAWKTMKLEFEQKPASKSNKMQRIKSVELICSLADQHLADVAAMEASRYVSPFLTEVKSWKGKLNCLIEVLESLITMESKLLEIEPILLNVGMLRDLPLSNIKELIKEWRKLEFAHRAEQNILHVICTKGYAEKLKQLHHKIDEVNQILAQYLTKKCIVCPRLYFLSTREQIKLLQCGTNLENVRDVLCKCFPGITDLRLGRQDNEVLGFCSATGEVLTLTEPILLQGTFDENILALENAMQSAVQTQTSRGCESLLKNPNKRDRWQRAFPLQVCVLATKIFWTLECIKTLQECEKKDRRKPLKLFKEDMQWYVNKLGDAIKGKQSFTERMKTAGLLTSGVHELSIIDQLYDSGCKDTTSFEWLSQLRYYRSSDPNAVEIRQMFGVFTHGLEYYGDPQQLVMTPQTDRSILHITTLLYLKMAGLMQGPSGCGKTEILKGLAMSLGRFLFIANCSRVINYLGFRSILTGIVQMGAWGLLRELPLLEPCVLAVASLDLLQVLIAAATGQQEVNLQGSNVKLHNNAAIFVTLTTTDERGHTDRHLPACLRPRFRPVAMRRPEPNLVVEIILLSEGIRDSNDFSLKICRLFELCSLHLSSQHHYDFSIRKMVHVARKTGEYKHLSFKADDEQLILQAIMLHVAPQLLPDDRRIFLEFTSDLFPGVEVPVANHRDLSIALQNALESSGLMPLTWSVKKSLQIFEALLARNCVILAGKSGSGKSTAWQMLSKALNTLSIPECNQVQVHPIYPNYLTYSELYGDFDENNCQYHNGLLTDKIRELCSDYSGKAHWIVLDGEIANYWTDMFMGILDNCRIMTTGNGEQINITEKMKVVIEAETLENAPPSLLSLSSCVYFDHKQLGYQPFIDAWLQKLKNIEMKNELSDLMAVNVDRCLEFKEKNCNELIPRSNLNAVQTLCQLIECFLLKTTENSHSKNGEEQGTFTKQWFYFCLVWSIFGAMQSEDRVKVDVFVRDLDVGVFPPDDLVFDYCVDYQWNGFVKWTDKFPLKFTYDKSVPIYKMNIPTLDLARYSFISSALVTGGHSILLTGHIGSGKSLIANYVLKNLDKDKYSTININGTSERTRCSLIQRLERKLEKRFNRALVPARGKTLVALIEDIGVTPLGEDGTQPTFEALRYWREHGNWIDAARNVARVQGVQIVATLRHGGARLTSRLSRHFSLLEIATPSENELYNLFTLPLAQHLLGFGEQIKLLCKVLLQSSIDMYKSVRLKLLATPINSHYAFSLKNLTEVIQGLLLSSKDHHNTKSAMCKLWIHENLRVYYDRISNLTDRLWFIRELSRQVTNHFGLSTTILCPGKRYPLFVHVRTDFWDEGGGAYIETSAEDEQERLEAILKGTHAVMFREAAEHVARAVRVLTRPSSHLLLLGQAGCGRHSLLKLACRVCNVQLVYAEVSSDPASQVETFREQMRTLVRRSAVLGQNTALLLSDSQVTQDTFLDIVNNIIQPGHIYDLFGDDVIEEIYNEFGITDRGNCFDPEIATEYIEGKVQEKLHIILCFDFDDPKFRERLKQFPSLASCTMDYFSEWSKDALLQVAKKYLARLELGDEEMQNEIRETVANLFAQFHDAVVEIVTNLKLKLTITPAHYVDCLKTYTLLLQKKQSELKDKTKKLEQGLKKIEETRQSVEIMADELLHAQRRVLERQRKCEAALVTLGQRRREVEEQNRALDSSAKQLVLEETAVQQLARLAHAAMDEAVPSLEDADMALDSLNHKELMEMRAYGRPPEAVELAMSAVLILKQAEPTWVEAKRQLADANFIDQLHNFDKDHIPDKTLKSITSFTLNPEFNPEKIGTVSAPAKYLAQWVLAIEKYARIYRVAAPKRAKLERASRDLREHQAELSDLKSRLAHLKSQLEDQKLAYENSLQIRDSLNAQAEEMGARLQRTNQLVSGLGTEEDIWRSHVEQYSSLKQLLIGDCFVVSALLNYAGPFSATIREQLQEKLTQLVNEAKVKCSSDISLANYLSNKATLMEWQMKGLPRDSYSVDSATIALQNSFIPSDSPSPVCRWPLLIDPQGLALNWLRSLQEFQELRITDQRKEDFAKTVGECIEKGMPLVIDKVEDTLNPILMPLLIKNLSKYGNEQPSIKFHEKDIPYHSGFRLYFRTLIQTPKYGPEISSRINVIDFTVQQKGLEETLLDVLITKEKPSLEKERTDLCADILTGFVTLENLEKSILRILTETSETLLDHGTVMESLENNKTATLSACKSLSAHHEAYATVEMQRENYLPCATRATILFSIQTHLQNLNPMYHFSLKSYIEEFENSVKSSSHNQNLSERLTAINEVHTINFYQTTNQALFVRDRLPFAFLLCIRLMEIEDQNIISVDLLNFLAQTVTIKLCDASETHNPSFVRLPDYVWDNVTKLERSSTKYHGLKESLIEFTKEWYTWFSSPDESPLIGKFGSLDALSQLVISTCLRPDRLAINVRRFIMKHSRQQLNEAVSFELVSSLANRLVLLLPGRDVDLTSGLEQLARITSNVQLVTPGQGQQKRIETVLHEAAKTGECVILIDCHLSLNWLNQFENIFENWSHSVVHNTFRCWISSESYPKFPIEIAQQAKKISVDKPEDLRLTIKRLSSDTSKDIKLNHNLILQMATLHAIFLHRLQFVSLGWNCNYDFSDNDFMTCCNLLSATSSNKSSSNHNNSDILMAVNLAYNCRVSDFWDQRLLAAITREVLAARTHPHSESRTIMILETNEENAVSTTGNHQQSTTILQTAVNSENYGLNRLASASVYLAESLNVQRALKLLFVSTPIDVKITVESIEMVLYTYRLILEILPEETNIIKFKRSLVIQRPMELVLLTEIENYNKLLYNIKKDIAEFRSAIKGFIEWSLHFNELFFNIAANIVPAQWEKFMHQDEKSTKNLLSWCQILSKKITLLQEWSVQLEPPEPINLAILQRPLAFLSALMQMNVAHLTDLDDMNWIFTIESSSTLNADEIPTLKDGCVLSGLRLEGAAWNKENSCLSEAKTSCIMPNIMMKPTRKSMHSKVQDAYMCPCFANDARTLYLFSVPLNPGENSPDHWVIRSVVLILHLE